MYNSIQAGRYVGDTIAAMDWMQETLGIGALWVRALRRIDQRARDRGVDTRIECLLGMGLPTVLEGGPENWARVLTQHQIVSMRTRTSGRSRTQVVDALFRGQVELPGHMASAQGWLSERRAIRRAIETGAAKSEVDNTNPLFASAFMAMLESARPMILFFAGADRLRYQFAENFESHHEARIRVFVTYTRSTSFQMRTMCSRNRLGRRASG